MQCVDVSMWGASSEFICKKNGANFSHEHVWILLVLSSFKPKVHCTYTAGGHVSLQQNRSSTTFIHTTEPETLGMNLWVRGQEIRNPDPGKHLLIPKEYRHRHHMGSQTTSRFFVTFHIISLGAFFLWMHLLSGLYSILRGSQVVILQLTLASWERNTSRSLLLKHSLKNCLEGGDFFRYPEIARFLAEPNHPAKIPRQWKIPPTVFLWQ